MIGIIDYGAGNLFSVKNALDYLGFNNFITSSPDEMREADKLILPGVGAFPDAMKMLRDAGLDGVIREEASKKPLLGICLGMQMLFEYGYEFEKTEGLSLIPGEVSLIYAPGLKIPHMGWSDVKTENSCVLSEGIEDGARLYYVHSYKADTDRKYISLYSEYGQLIPGLVFKDNVFGTQFHPEKSGEIGLRILKNFGGLK
ncbi:imidazole glycerol phosphate synthase subunit HisH [Sinanaerobacter chloroacetimidivorans]|uniref:Imidazole glycerol phosphate synthase subunit HisH n=1 Tax=Sinanaerobacter chloroacetimidivorans TaxID=2818044 RepID=A0A8J7W4V9_9FIRM|nr:imidazole glycerol phosphate synthase subunit HisH [Sinanaerobacter chloroacetimidivorans]MBR0599086.1 imidazole glycerol phosphate synthase subunit HisH [Sinanaerobacter chloroacetimidivorans]